jgi:hypothetical protein
MHKRSSKKIEDEKNEELNQQARKIADSITDGREEELVKLLASVEEGKNPAAVALGRLGGIKGGKARAKKLSAKRRQEIAQNAASKRWGKTQHR